MLKDYRKILLQRQTVDWAGQEYSNADAARRYASIAFINENKDFQENLYKETLLCLDFWDQVFSVSFAECRRQMRQIAHESWLHIADVDEIIWNCDQPDLDDRLVNKKCIVLVSDDDDWYAPHVFQEIVEHGSTPDPVAWVWRRTKFHGALELSPLSGEPIYTYTNNYALNGNDLPPGTSITRSMGHGSANQIVRSNLDQTVLLHSSFLSVTNKAPCSLNMIQQVLRAEDPKSLIVDRVSQYVNTEPQITPELEWSRKLISQAQEVFQTMLK